MINLTIVDTSGKVRHRGEGWVIIVPWDAKLPVIVSKPTLAKFMAQVPDAVMVISEVSDPQTGNFFIDVLRGKLIDNKDDVNAVSTHEILFDKGER